jgi:DNA polymerase-3 subunit alpha/error-prone DNA polymerase
MATLIEYVELVARSHYSFLQGSSHPKELVNLARDLGYQGIGISDLNGFYGSIQGYKAYLNKPLFENNLSKDEGNPKTLEKLNTPFLYLSGVELILNQHHYIFYPRNLLSYQQISRFLSQQHQKKDLLKKQDISFEEASPLFSDGYILALPPWNQDQLESLRKLYGPYLYLAIYRNQTRQSFVWQQEAFQFEKNKSYQLVACQRVLFATPQDKELYDLLNCIKNRLTFDSGIQYFLTNREHYIKPLNQLYILWRDRPDLLLNSVKIAQDITFQWDQIRYHYPKARTPNGIRPIDYLKSLCLNQIPERLSKEAFTRHQMQFEKEISLIEELKYEDYFLTLYEITQFAKQNHILFQGRGSAANSIVCYLLGLTAVHPDQIQMLFERFISRERNEPPDIDIDFDSQRREEVIQFIFQRYGPSHAAQVANVICFRHKSAIREVGLALNFSSDLIKKMQSTIEYKKLDSPLELSSFLGGEISKDKIEKWLKLSARLLETPRHLGLHSGGFVLTDIPLDHIVPIEKATHPGRYMIQWNKDDIETLSMMKVDILGLGMLNALNKCFDLLKKHKNIEMGLYKAPPDDPKTYDMIQKAQTVGVFQIESRAQMSMLPKLKPKNYYDLVIQIAMVRPGPIEGGLVGPFLKNRNLKIKPQYPMPELAHVLDRTHGVPIFQEQIMQVMMIAANFTPGEADQMRRLLGQSSKKQKEMNALYQRIIRGMKQNKIDDSFIQQTLNTIKGFSAYGFPESHSASFAHIAYMSCYLKCHHPEVFVCSLLNSQPMGFYSPRTLIQEAKSRNLIFLPLHILKSKWEYQLEPIGQIEPLTKEKLDRNKVTPFKGQNLHAVRQGFLSLQYVNKSTVTQIESWQTLHQDRFHDDSLAEDLLKSLIFETQIPPQQIEIVIQSGAFSFTKQSTASILWMFKNIISDRGKPISQMITELQFQYKSPNLPIISELKSRTKDYQQFGYSLNQHPIEWIRELHPHFKTSQLLKSHDLKRCYHNQRVSTLGLLAIKQKPPTANGVCFLSLEDEFGISNIIVWPDIYKKYRIILSQSRFLIVTGKIQNKIGIVNLLAEHIWPVEE